MSDDAVIEMSGVAVANPHGSDVPVVAVVDWRVARGECWVVAGQQGSGKTTVIETAAGLRPASRGEVRLFGEPLPSSAGEAMARLRQRVGFVFEGAGRLFPDLGVGENIALPLRYHRHLTAAESSAELRPLMEAFQLERFANLAPGRIGRAWARRAGLARAMASRPELVLLDNPLEGLDPVHLRWWRGFLAELVHGHPWLGGKPATVVIATDELRPLLGIGTRFATVDRGLWKVLGDRGAVSASDDPAVRELMDERN